MRMRSACKCASFMPNVQIRNVPEGDHRRLKARAAMEGQSLSEFALAVLRRSLDRPTHEELVARLEAAGPAARPTGREIDAAALVRAERDTR